LAKGGDKTEVRGSREAENFGVSKWYLIGREYEEKKEIA